MSWLKKKGRAAAACCVTHVMRECGKQTRFAVADCGAMSAAAARAMSASKRQKKQPREEWHAGLTLGIDVNVDYHHHAVRHHIALHIRRGGAGGATAKGTLGGTLDWCQHFNLYGGCPAGYEPCFTPALALTRLLQPRHCSTLWTMV